MNDLEREYLDIALANKKLYETTKWWKFKKRKHYYKMWQSALDLMIKNTK